VTQASATLVNRVTTGNADSGRMKKLIIILAILLVVGAGATTHLYKKHKRPVHSPVLKATLPSSHPEEPAANIANIHDARIPVRTEKNQLSEAKLEPVVAACSEPHDIAGQETFAWTSSNNTAMEEVLSQRQAKALHEQVGCTLITEASPQ
jgi:hypothetical protein